MSQPDSTVPQAEANASRRPGRSRWSTRLIIGLTIAVVLVPVFVPREISRWYLAAAANASRLKDPLLARHYLDKAIAWDASVQQDSDFWIAQLPPTEVSSADGVLDVIEQALAIDRSWASKARQAAFILAEGYDYARAVRAQKMAVKATGTDISDLNQLAYYRSLANIELEEALKDIDQAIRLQLAATGDGKTTSADPALVDTKAWVLHRLGRNEEALELIGPAIESMTESIQSLGKLPSPVSNSDRSLCRRSLSHRSLSHRSLSHRSHKPLPIRSPSHPTQSHPTQGRQTQGQRRQRRVVKRRVVELRRA